MPESLPLEELKLSFPLSPDEESLIRLGGRFHCTIKRGPRDALAPAPDPTRACWAVVEIMNFGQRDAGEAYVYCPGCRRVTGFAYTTELSASEWHAPST